MGWYVLDVVLVGMLILKILEIVFGGAEPTVDEAAYDDWNNKPRTSGNGW